MKKSIMMIAALALVAMPAASYGAADVWFELVSGTNGVMQVGNAGPGQVLQLEKPADENIYTIQLRMMANVTTTALFSANTTVSADSQHVVATTWAAMPPAGGAATPAGGLNTAGPGPIATNFGAATFSPPGYLGDGINLGTLTIEVRKPTGGLPDNTVHTLTATIGTGLWGQSDFAGAMVRYGGGAFGNGGVVGGATGTIVQITNIPEPATLSLIGLGAIALIRRRR